MQRVPWWLSPGATRRSPAVVVVGLVALGLALGTWGCDRRDAEAPGGDDVDIEAPAGADADTGGDAADDAPDGVPDPESMLVGDDPPAAKRGRLATWDDLLAEVAPEIAAQDPSRTPLPFSESARVTLDEHVFLDAIGTLWISHPRGRPAAEIIADLNNGERPQPAYVVRDKVVFAWWRPGPGRGRALELIVEEEGSGGRHEWLHPTGGAIFAVPAHDEFDWQRAWAWNGMIVVPTREGAAILKAGDRPDAATYMRRYGRVDSDRRPDGGGSVEVTPIRLRSGASHARARPQVRVAARGLIAWVPWESADRPGGRIARFDGEEWHVLDGEDGFADRPVHIMPLTDGSFLQLSMDEAGSARLSIAGAADEAIDAARVRELVAELASSDGRVRESAFYELSRMGPGALGVLEEAMEGATPFVRRQLEILLLERQRLTLGGLLPEPGPVEVQQWLGDGGVVLRFPAGILIEEAGGISMLHRPAFVEVRPGRRTRLLPEMLADEVRADGRTVLSVWGDEYIVCRPGRPPRRWGLNHFQQIIPADVPDADEWRRLRGIDRQGRWIFEPADDAPPTLIVDIRRPDGVLRLPTWVIVVPDGGEAGWDDEDWPVQKLGHAWRLRETSWETLGEEAPVHYLPGPAEADADSERLLVEAPDGRRFYDGGDRLVMEIAGRRREIPLPEEASGRHQPLGAVDEEGRLFLFNAPGRVVRLDPSADGGLEVKAVFTGQLPDRMPTRVWIDPAGRLCAAYAGDAVAIMWTDGTVPGEIRQMMPEPGTREGPHPLEGI